MFVITCKLMTCKKHCSNFFAFYELFRLKQMHFEKGDILVFDKAYNDYEMFHDWTQEGIFFCTRQKEDAIYKVVQLLYSHPRNIRITLEGIFNLLKHCQAIFPHCGNVAPDSAKLLTSFP